MPALCVWIGRNVAILQAEIAVRRNRTEYTQWRLDNTLAQAVHWFVFLLLLRQGECSYPGQDTWFCVSRRTSVLICKCGKGRFFHFLCQSRFSCHHISNAVYQPAPRNSEHCITLILRRSRTGTVWFYTSTSNKRAARPKLYTKSLTRDLKLMYSRFTVVRISINL